MDATTNMSNAIFLQRTQKFAVLGRRDGEEQHLAPDWLLSPLLSGCYEMAPEFILKTQTGWGRAIRYSVLQRLPLALILTRHGRGRLHAPAPLPRPPEPLQIHRFGELCSFIL